ncbi:actin-binding Rho-activating protein isoform X1 [Drosophila nasuta]|uniref:actin-binding Rho-activating protein isoform X1 n=2 Tax=Drosophila nasuta TaxID=42062 RepID=UPI00295E23A3|nr:actin-binding Rho-activating protein isoform X1 [Drosophila nasuta]
MTEQTNNEDNTVLSRIMLFNEHVKQHQQWQSINPFSHCSVKDMPKRSFLKDQYGTAPPGSLSQQRALQAQMISLQEILQLCQLINEKCEARDSSDISLKFGELFELYNHISDKLLGTLLCARRHKYVDFDGETLFQGRDDAKHVRLLRPFAELSAEIADKIESLRPVEHPELRDNNEAT